MAMDLRMYAKYLDCLIRSESLRTAMGEASRKRALAIYSWPSVVKQYEALGAELSQRTVGVKYEPRRAQSYARPSYFKMFNHYATNCLDDNTILTQGSMAEDLGDISRIKPSYHPAMEYRLLDPKLLVSAIALMARRTRVRSRRRNRVSSHVSSGVTMGEMAYKLNCHKNHHPDRSRVFIFSFWMFRIITEISQADWQILLITLSGQWVRARRCLFPRLGRALSLGTRIPRGGAC